MRKNRRLRPTTGKPENSDPRSAQMVLALPGIIPSGQRNPSGGTRAEARILPTTAAPGKAPLAAPEPDPADTPALDTAEAADAVQQLGPTAAPCADAPARESQVSKAPSPSSGGDNPCILQTIRPYPPQDAGSVSRAELSLPIPQLLEVYELLSRFVREAEPEPGAPAGGGQGSEGLGMVQ